MALAIIYKFEKLNSVKVFWTNESLTGSVRSIEHETQCFITR